MPANISDDVPHGSTQFDHYQRVAHFAALRGDMEAIKRLGQDLAGLTDIDDGQRQHLRELIAQGQSNIDERATEGFPVEDMQRLFAEYQSAGIRLIEEAQQANAESLLDGPSAFEQSQRIAIFAGMTEDAPAVEKLEKELPQLPGLNDEQRRHVKKLIDKARPVDKKKPAPDKSSNHPPGDVSPQPADGPPGGTPVDELPTDGAPGAGSPSQPPAGEPTDGTPPTPTDGTPSVPPSDETTTPPGNEDRFKLPSAAEALFSTTYKNVRNSYLKDFLYQGMTAEYWTDLGNGKRKVKFADQTQYLGFALLTFAGEARILKNAGLSTQSSEGVIGELLKAFEECEGKAEKDLYGSSVSGFFVRDAVHTEKAPLPANRHGIPDNWELQSDCDSTLHEVENRPFAAMSLDQVTNLFAGWWAVRSWSTKDHNIKLAIRQADRVMGHLMNRLFVLELPDGSEIKRGAECRHAAGFLCRMAEAVTGKNYIQKAKIKVGSISGGPFKIKHELGEITLPGFSFPITIPVLLSHAAILALKPIALVAMRPAEIPIRLSDLFPEHAQQIKINTPCVHLVPKHPNGHKVPCIHPTALHPGGDPGPTLPCVHLEPEHTFDKKVIPCVHPALVHPGGDPGPTLPCTHFVPEHAFDTKTIPCVHPTVLHPEGDPGPTLPCTHLTSEHPYDWKKVGPLKTKVPCTHIVQKHPEGHPTTVPCIHLTVAHPEGHEVQIPCTHLKPAHPEGHPTTIPCVHLTVAHPEGHEVEVPCVHLKPAHPEGHPTFIPCIHLTAAHPDGDNVPCPHLTAAHPEGHPPTFDVKLSDLDFAIPLNFPLPFGLGDLPSFGAFERHLMLLSMAFESAVNDLEMLAAAKSSNHPWSVLLRAAVMNTVNANVPVAIVTEDLKNFHSSCPADGPSNAPNGTPWVKDNRWVRCTDGSEPGAGDQKYNGLDFLSLEVLMRVRAVLG